MDLKTIQEIIKLVNKTDLSEVEIEQDDFKIKIKKGTEENQVVYNIPPVANVPNYSLPPAQTQTHQQPVVAINPPNTTTPETISEEIVPETTNSNIIEFKAPIIGTFYRRPSPDKPMFINEGDTISKGDILCIIEAMKLFNEIEADFSGKIVKIMVDDSQPVEYDQVLFTYEPLA